MNRPLAPRHAKLVRLAIVCMALMGCGVAAAPLQQGPVNAANPANAVQPMPANPPRLLTTAPGT